MQSLPENNPVLFFDGVCNLCNRWVQFVIKRDSKKNFYFSPLQSEAGHEIPMTDAINVETVVLYYKGKYYTKSTAVMKIASLLGGVWGLLNAGYIIPVKLRNALYDMIARNRYKWFGKQESCMIPTPELKARFIE